MMDVGTDLKIVGLIMRDVGAFTDGRPVVLQIPPTDTIVDASEFGLGKIRVQQGGSPLTITKMPQ